MFLLMSGLSAYLRIFLVLALAPAVILMVYVYRLDPLDKEPVNLCMCTVWTPSTRNRSTCCGRSS